MGGKEAAFTDRNRCIACGSERLEELSGGLFGEEPLRGFIERDPWGENPMPYIENKRWSFVRCEDCGQMFHRYVLSPEWNEVRFDSWMTPEAIERFAEPLNTPENRFAKAREHAAHILRIERMTRRIRGGRGVKILDFGCGWGGFLAAAVCFGFRGYGVDPSPSRGGLGGYVAVFENLDELKREMGVSPGFHAVTLFEVLEHLEDPLRVLSRLGELMVRGGILVLETPDCTGVTGIVDETSYRKIHPLDHLNAFTPGTLRRMAERAGFKRVEPWVSHVTVERRAILKEEVKHLLRRFRRAATRQYFRKA